MKKLFKIAGTIINIISYVTTIWVAIGAIAVWLSGNTIGEYMDHCGDFWD